MKGRTKGKCWRSGGVAPFPAWCELTHRIARVSVHPLQWSYTAIVPHHVHTKTFTIGASGICPSPLYLGGPGQVEVTAEGSRSANVKHMFCFRCYQFGMVTPLNSHWLRWVMTPTQWVQTHILCDVQPSRTPKPLRCSQLVNTWR